MGRSELLLFRYNTHKLEGCKWWEYHTSDLATFEDVRSASVLASPMPRSSRTGGGVLSSFSSGLFSDLGVFSPENTNYELALHTIQRAQELPLPTPLFPLTVSSMKRTLKGVTSELQMLTH